MTGFMSQNVLLFALVLVESACARTFTVVNACPFTVWPGVYTDPAKGSAVPLVEGGWEATSGSSRTFYVPDNWAAGRIWGRRGCDFTNVQGPESCLTGGCEGGLNCTQPGVPPSTLAEWTLSPTSDAPDFYDVSLVDGYDLPMRISTNKECPVAECPVDLDSVCPDQLKGAYAPDGLVVSCKTSCQANLDGNQANSTNCCSGAFATPETCPRESVAYVDFFKIPAGLGGGRLYIWVRHAPLLSSVTRHSTPLFFLFSLVTTNSHSFAMFVNVLAVSALASVAFATECTRTYTIKAGDWCDTISQAHNVSTYQLSTVNADKINDACTNLEIGQQLCLGTKGQDCTTTHTVVAGDNCDKIMAGAGLNDTVLYHNNPQIDDYCGNIYIGKPFRLVLPLLGKADLTFRPGEVLCVANAFVAPAEVSGRHVASAGGVPAGQPAPVPYSAAQHRETQSASSSGPAPTGPPAPAEHDDDEYDPDLPECEDPNDDGY
ncbi:hypothetical protein FRC07_013747 [Ceratobasidium sp. 392]|nr:hypothetical protein FRC07_013747 [Ceratobasidium sp. 392]